MDIESDRLCDLCNKTTICVAVDIPDETYICVFCHTKLKNKLTSLLHNTETVNEYI